VKRSIIVCIVIVLSAVIAPSKTAFADDPAPTKEQLDQAKKAFGEGKALFDEGKLNEAIDKFKESYRLSRNPLLLYNIGFTLDQSGAKDKALFYYRKFLADAPKAATQRKEVEKRVNLIEKENLEADLAGTTTTTPTNTGNATTTTTKPKEEVKTAVTVKPAGTYSATDFQHQMIDAAPPGKPLDVTAFVPEDSGWTVTLYYRGNGDTKFFARTMRWRYKELVARIPAMKIGGSTIQYYIEVKDQTGNVVTRSGKSTSPNLINVDNTVAPRFYPDFTDEGEAPVQTAVQMKRHDEEDPLNSGGSSQVVEDEPNGGGTSMVGGGVSETPTAGGNGFSDVGSSKFSKAKWISTSVAGAGVAAAMVGYILGKKQADNIVTDSQDCPMGATPPCRKFDLDYDKAVEDAGKRYNTINTVGTVVGVSAGVVAAYFWYRQLTAKKHGELKVSKSGGSPETVWAITPSITDGFTGAAAAARF
jgi:hypothetical protein